MSPSKAILLMNSSENKLFVYTLLTIFSILSVPYCTANNIALASNPFTLLNPFTTANDICNDGIDNDGDGFVDDNCGTPSLKVTKDPSGEVSNISSICHEDCEIDWSPIPRTVGTKGKEDEHELWCHFSDQGGYGLSI